jgi:hypothetical protein
MERIPTAGSETGMTRFDVIASEIIFVVEESPKVSTPAYF